MFDISGMSQKYGLTTEQTKIIENAYLALPEERRENFGQADFEALLANQGWQRGGDDPPMPPPKYDLDFAGLELMPTPGAAVMALITKNAAEQRQINKNIKAAEAEEVAKTIEEQAEEMKKKAVLQLVMGCISGAVSIAGGLCTACRAGSALGAKMESGQAMLKSTQLGGEQSAWQGLSTIFSTVSQYYGTVYDANIKEMDAKIERTRSGIDALKDLNEALTDLIRKSLQTSESVQESSNQARAKILG
jgi:hypothetical protein